MGVLSFGIGEAASMRVGHGLGAGAPDRAARSGWVAIQITVLIEAVLVVGVTANAVPIARWVLGDAHKVAVAAAAALLPIAACLQFLDGVQAAASGALIGFRDAKGPLLIAAIGSWAVGMPAGVLLAWTMAVPVQGLWIGLAIGAGLTMLLYLARFRQKITHLQPGALSEYPP